MPETRNLEYDVFLSHSAKDTAVARALMERPQGDGVSRPDASGLDFDNMPEDRKRVINNLPAMLYHGVNTEAAVLMRMNAVPRSIAVGLGERFSAAAKDGADLHSVRSARSYLRNLSANDWQRSAPAHTKMSGEDYRNVWSLLAGERCG
jgi:hypothetical protein